MTTFDADAIPNLLNALDGELERRGVTADIYLVGGAAMALSFDSARTTRDIDAVFAPTAEVRAAVESVADDRGLPADWLNVAVKGFVPPIQDARQWVVFESAHLRVCVAGLEHLLAMKVAASRVIPFLHERSTCYPRFSRSKKDREIESTGAGRARVVPAFGFPNESALVRSGSGGVEPRAAST